MVTDEKNWKYEKLLTVEEKTPVFMTPSYPIQPTVQLTVQPTVSNLAPRSVAFFWAREISCPRGAHLTPADEGVLVFFLLMLYKQPNCAGLPKPTKSCKVLEPRPITELY